MIGPCLSVIKRHHQFDYRILLSLTAWFIYCPVALADGVRGLQEIYETPIPAQIRKSFNHTIQIYNTCPECALGVLDGEKFIDIYPKKFIVLSLSPNSFGGFWAFIAVEGERRNTFRLWLYDVSDKEYDLRSIEELTESLDEEFNRWLDSPTHHSYWL